MTLLRRSISSLLPVGLLVLQLSCGGDSSGPGHVPTSMAANSSITLTAAPGTQVTELPSVLVRDESGAPLVGASVTFAVTSGGGSVTGGTAVTNPSGIATVGSWTLGAAGGTNTLAATIASLPAVTFTANGFDPCANATAHTLGSTVNGQLSTSDCLLQDQSFVDFYAVTLPASGTYIFSETSPTFDTFVALLTGANVLVGFNDDFQPAPAPPDSRLKVIVPAGLYIIGANSYLASQVGNYSLTSAASTEQVINCEDVFVVRGITTPQSLQTGDCSTSGFLSDEYVIYLAAGQTVTVSMTSSVLDSYLEIRAPGNPQPVLAFNDDADQTTKNAQVSYTVPATAPAGFYIIAAASKVAAATGDYTLTVQ
jgi:hypothetical protein